VTWLRKKKSRTSTEATAARIRAEQQLKATREKTPMYRELGESLRQIREENNFAPAIASALRGGAK